LLVFNYQYVKTAKVVVLVMVIVYLKQYCSTQRSFFSIKSNNLPNQGHDHCIYAQVVRESNYGQDSCSSEFTMIDLANPTWHHKQTLCQSLCLWASRLPEPDHCHLIWRSSNAWVYS